MQILHVRLAATVLTPLRSRLDELGMFPLPIRASRLGERNVARCVVRLALDERESARFATS